jgi:Spy/CpxP family protein refolding chaperone
MDGWLLWKGSIYLNPSELIMNETRRSKIHELFYKAHEDIFQAQQQALQEARQAQYAIITEKVNQYIRRVEDLTTQFRRLDLSLLSPEYFEEYTQAIYRYDEVIRDLLEKHAQYESDFKAVWDAHLGGQLTSVFEQVLDFHHRYIFKSLNKRNEQITRFAKTKNKKERQDMEADLKKEKRIFEETMNDQWPVIKSNVERFLYNLRGQLN